MIAIRMVPVDTLFFRDGTPFSAGSASQEDVGGLFPPHPPTVAGALRAALARLRGWSGIGRWPEHLNETLGDGPSVLGTVSFSGPFLLRSEKLLYPVPRNVLGVTIGRSWKPRALLRPGEPIICDIGHGITLPEVSRADSANETVALKPGDRCWITQRGLESLLRGEIPDFSDVLPSYELWKEERRVGLERNDASRTAQEGMLYSTRHVRPRKSVDLGVLIDGLPPDWDFPEGHLVALGGETRLAECLKWESRPSIETPLDAIERSGRLLVVALSPLDLDAEICSGRGLLNELGKAQVVSACFDRPQRIGGWDSLSRKPIPVRSILPAGSVLFCELRDPKELREEVEARGGILQIGERNHWGFGMVALGTW